MKIFLFLVYLQYKSLCMTIFWCRRYKTSHVWQDLLDDDLITPISDNEYILKGSEIIPTTFDKGKYHRIFDLV